MKVSIVSLGCSKNLVDSELILGALTHAGHTVTPEGSADVIIVNTCGFIGDSIRESVNTIVDLAEYRKKGGCRKLIVTGCLVERFATELAREIPEVDAFWGTGDLGRLPELLEPFAGEIPYTSPPGTIYDPDSPRLLTTPAHTAFLKVSEGCSRTCSFCIIPRLRGLMRSRTVESVTGEARNLARGGVREINLIAQDMTSYGRDIGTDLETLLRSLAALDGLDWIRLHYCYPWGMTDSLLDTIEAAPRILPYIDMPLQHINDRILSAMERKTSSASIREILTRVRERLTSPTLRTTFIVGFPGEGEAEFAELCDFVEEVRFDRVGAFRYSHEQGTAAGDGLADTVSPEEKEERYERLIETQADISLAKNTALVGTVHDAFIDSVELGGATARMASQAPEVDGVVHLSGAGFTVGSLVSVRITGADVYDLTAEPLGGAVEPPRVSHYTQPA